MQRFLKNILVVFLMLFVLNGYSQRIHVIVFNDSLEKVRNLKVKDSAIAMSKIEDWVLSLRQRGFLEASADSLIWNKNILNVYLHKGPRYFFDTIVIISLQDSFIYAPRKRFFTYPRLQEIVNQQLSELRDNGYAMAHTKQEDFFISDKNRIGAEIHIEAGDVFVYDTLTIMDTLRISKRFLWSYLNLIPGERYSAEDIAKIPQRLSYLPFVSLSDTPQVEFYPGLARPVLFLHKQAANSAQGMLGFQFENNKLISIGHLNISLNGLVQAESFTFNWDKPRINWQQIDINLQVPYLMGTPLGTTVGYYAQKIDTTQFNVRLNLGISYFLQYMNNVAFGYTSENNFVIHSVNNQTNVHKRYFTTTMHIDTRDRSYNPLYGWFIDTHFSYGQKFFNDSTQRSLFIHADVNRFFYLEKRFVFHLRFLSSAYFSPVIFDNEVMHIGGYSDLRGFGEQELRATQFALFTVEPRLLLNSYSNVFVFSEASRVVNKTITKNESFYTFALGLGINLRTKSGLLNITYALGGKKGYLSPRASKIHIAFRAIF